MIKNTGNDQDVVTLCYLGWWNLTTSFTHKEGRFNTFRVYTVETVLYKMVPPADYIRHCRHKADTHQNHRKHPIKTPTTGAMIKIPYMTVIYSTGSPAHTETHTHIHHSREMSARRCHGNRSPWQTHGERWREYMKECKGEWWYWVKESVCVRQI